MTLVNADTGEVLELSYSDARDLIDRIKDGLARDWRLVVRAYQKRAWASLGYKSWDELQAKEFGSSALRLPRESRQEAVASLREAGLSIRAIAAATGASFGAVQSDLSGDQKRSPDLDDEVVDAEIVDPPKVTGTDGKSYSSRSQKGKRADRARELAALGYTSAQIADDLGITRNGMASFRKRYGIEVPADAVPGLSNRNVDYDRVVREIGMNLDGLASAARQCDVSKVSEETVLEWADSLEKSLSALNRFRRDLNKESARG